MWACRLPSEAEWEYACRAGTKSRYSFGDEIAPDDANYEESRLGHPSEIGAKLYLTNGWSLYDMHGNVLEWVQDDCHSNYQGAPADGSAWKAVGGSADSGYRVLRGGSWDYPSRDCRSASRRKELAGMRGRCVGFRVARTLS